MNARQYYSRSQKAFACQQEELMANKGSQERTGRGKERQRTEGERVQCSLAPRKRKIFDVYYGRKSREREGKNRFHALQT